MATEMQTKKTEDTSQESFAELDPNALAAIRDLLETEPEIAAQPVAERRAERTADAAAAAPAPKPQRVRPAELAARPAATPQRVQAEVASDPDAQAAAPRARRKLEGGGLVDTLKARVTGYRPKPKHLILGSLALLILFRPWLVAGILFLGLLVTLGVFLILGYDGFWRRAMGVARWYARRRPSRAGELHRKLDNFAMKWDAILDRFPEGSVDGLYLPDFGDLATADARHDEALDRRFSNLNESGA